MFWSSTPIIHCHCTNFKVNKDKNSNCRCFSISIDSNRFKWIVQPKTPFHLVPYLYDLLSFAEDKNELLKTILTSWNINFFGGNIPLILKQNKRADLLQSHQTGRGLWLDDADLLELKDTLGVAPKIRTKTGFFILKSFWFFQISLISIL